jgi:hypothetical protein
MFASVAAADSTGLSPGHTLVEQVNPNPQSNLLPPALALMCCSMVLDGANSLFISTTSLQLAPSPNMRQLLLIKSRTICQCTAYQPFAVDRGTSTRAQYACARTGTAPQPWVAAVVAQPIVTMCGYVQSAQQVFRVYEPPPRCTDCIAVTRCSSTLQEKFQPYFADAGYDSWAVSLRGQGGSDPVQGASVAGTLPTAAIAAAGPFNSSALC